MNIPKDLTTDASSEAECSTTAADIPVGLPGYELLEDVGRGGMRVGFRARDAALGCDVAVKVLADRYAPNSPIVQRFLNEARITGQL